MSGKHGPFSMRRLLALSLLVGGALALLAPPTYSDGPQFELSWGAAVGGGGASTGGSYGVSGAAGSPAADELSGEDFSLRGGVEVGAVIVPPMAVADLSGSPTGSDLALAWPAVTHDVRGDPITVDHYVVYRRADEPYFDPTPTDVVGTPAAPGFTDPGVLGDPAHNVYYLVSAVDVWGAESAPSIRLGAFDLELVAAGAPGERAYNMVAVPLDLPGVTDADSLAAYAGPGTYLVLRHDAPTQAVEWRLPGLAGTNFSVSAGDAVYLYLDDAAPGVVSLVGAVPDPGMVSFALARPAPGDSCAYNFISVPLDRDDLVDADALAADIGGVHSVSRYNAAMQSLEWRLPGVSGDNFPVRPGYPYIVCLDETAPPVWP